MTLAIIPDMTPCQIISYPKPISYADALAQQQMLFQQCQANEVGDTVLLLEHPPTITLGRGTEPGDLLSDAADLGKRGITVVSVDRGGEITYHAPGQLVGYPILDLRNYGQDLHKYLRDLEETVISTLREFGVVGYRIAGLTGIWVDERKIAAIGIKVSRWVTMHGFALNITPDLTPFRQDFIPCGIRDRGVTSLAEVLPSPPSRSDVEQKWAYAFSEVFQMPVTFLTREV